MLSSMTAYSRTQTLTALGRFVVEIQSVNRKHLEINILLPKELFRFDAEIRKLISNSILRGQVTVKITAHFDQSTHVAVIPNLSLARQIKKAWEAIVLDLGIQPKTDFLLDVLAESEVISFEEELQDEGAYHDAILQAVSTTLQGFLDMRLKEGDALQNDILDRLEKLQRYISQIEKFIPGATDRYFQKLRERLNALSENAIENEERLLREICIYAEKIDIAEEITRLASHINQSLLLIHSETKGVGKTFEFLIQEMNREINTIGSKSSSVEISKLVIEVKTELERIREQIQNIE